MNSLSITGETKEILKSPGGWFFASNAVLYSQTHPFVAVFFLAVLVLQRFFTYRVDGTQKSTVVKFLCGSQGILATNALLTLGSAEVAVVYGIKVLALSGLAFGFANLTQALLYSHTLLPSGTPQAEDKRHIVLAVCEFLIALGLALIAVNAGYSYAVSFGLIIPVVIAGFVRSFRSHWLPPGLAYADMMLLSVLTGHEALMTGNILNAISRAIVLIGLTRLAVLRARNEGKVSFFEIETRLRDIWMRLRNNRR
jgi:hypothetical protein